LTTKRGHCRATLSLRLKIFPPTEITSIFVGQQPLFIMPGGVCAVLDYEVEVMAEYISEMATRVVTPEAQVTPAFRKFVSQILTSTRLPSTTILLGMNYLAKRVNSMKSQGPYKASEGQVWRYLTVSLLLGSKFLDDNTFQNRSWSEVSGISVAELNSLEFDWVQSMNWRLYVNLDLSKDYQAWLENWREWQHMKKRQVHASRERLASLGPAIDSDLARYTGTRLSPHSRYINDQIAEYERYQTLKSQQQQQQPQSYRSRENPWAHNPWNAAPLTPPDSGYGTPEYNVSTTSTSARPNEWYPQGAQYPARYPNAGSSSHHNGYYNGRHGNFASGYQYAHGYGNRSIWEHGLAECSCPGCATSAKHTPYFPAHGYGQPVMG
jgi:hypothetical protein